MIQPNYTSSVASTLENICKNTEKVLDNRNKKVFGLFSLYSPKLEQKALSELKNRLINIMDNASLNDDERTKCQETLGKISEKINTAQNDKRHNNNNNLLKEFSQTTKTISLAVANSTKIETPKTVVNNICEAKGVPVPPSLQALLTTEMKDPKVAAAVNQVFIDLADQQARIKAALKENKPIDPKDLRQPDSYYALQKLAKPGSSLMQGITSLESFIGLILPTNSQIVEDGLLNLEETPEGNNDPRLARYYNNFPNSVTSQRNRFDEDAWKDKVTEKAYCKTGEQVVDRDDHLSAQIKKNPNETSVFTIEIKNGKTPPTKISQNIDLKVLELESHELEIAYRIFSRMPDLSSKPPAELGRRFAREVNDAKAKYGFSVDEKWTKEQREAFDAKLPALMQASLEFYKGINEKLLTDYFLSGADDLQNILR